MWDFVMDKSGAGAGFLRGELRDFPCQSTFHLLLHNHLHYHLPFTRFAFSSNDPYSRFHTENSGFQYSDKNIGPQVVSRSPHALLAAVKFSAPCQLSRLKTNRYSREKVIQVAQCGKMLILLQWMPPAFVIPWITQTKVLFFY
jgi:hypothetical protein